MEINVLFSNVKIYSVQNRLDVVQGQTFSLEILEELPPDFDIFTNKDPVLEIDGYQVKAVNLGESKIRFMAGVTILKDLVINVVESINPLAVSLNTEFQDAQPK